MKEYKIYIILIIIVLILIAFFTTKIILENNYSSKYDEIYKDNWYLIKVEIYKNNKVETMNETGIVFIFNEKKLNICYENLCDEASYSIENNKLKIKEDKNGFDGNYEIEYNSDSLSLKLTDDVGYTKYYLTKPAG